MAELLTGINVFFTRVFLTILVGGMPFEPSFFFQPVIGVYSQVFITHLLTSYRPWVLKTAFGQNLDRHNNDRREVDLGQIREDNPESTEIEK